MIFLDIESENFISIALKHNYKIY